jgi:hypothetical protein
MKNIILGIVATLIVAGAFVYANNFGVNKSSDCCSKNSDCCYKDSECCEK